MLAQASSQVFCATRRTSRYAVSPSQPDGGHSMQRFAVAGLLYQVSWILRSYLQ
jgi:hypothetical protein